MKHTNSRPWTRIMLVLVLILVAGWIVPHHLGMPVEGATRRSYDQHSFWAYLWGESVTHKGVDIFAERGTNVHSARILRRSSPNTIRKENFEMHS